MGGETKASADPHEIILHSCVFLFENQGMGEGEMFEGGWLNPPLPDVGLLHLRERAEEDFFE